MRIRLLAASTAAIVLGATAAQAGVTELNAALDSMSYYNLIVKGDVTTTSEVEGRGFVGGALKGQATQFNMDNLSGTGLTVVGNVEGGKKNTWGDIKVGGNVASGVEFQSAGAQVLSYGGTLSNTNVNSPDTAVQVAGLGATLAAERDTMFANLDELSLYLKNLDSTDTTTLDGSNLKFDAGAGSGVAVFSIDNLSAALATTSDLKFVFPTDYDMVVINVAGANISLPGGFNFNGPANLGTKVIWNFYEATTLDFGSKAWYGSVLATHAQATIGNFIEGTAVFAGLTANGEIHTPGFTNYDIPPPSTVVPEPATWAMMILGFGAIGSAIRRRRTAIAA
ncbi:MULTISPECIES: choice-of-anchor A family protein [unclassified Phenylobacterium]|uniref:choice-of-anchor A family protein n=1 Tax=unclassified Phenylobacterium TaxID=2640670 RepID=UPI00083AAADE|nr:MULTISPECIES: choice-of-anchor A family protein [unclassified Phenylobacterium]